MALYNYVSHFTLNIVEVYECYFLYPMLLIKYLYTVNVVDSKVF